MNSILELNESEIVKFVFNRFGWNILQSLSINSSVNFYYEINKIIENGDLDLLITTPNSYKETILLECKRIKVKIEEDQTETINKVEDLKKLVGQVNNRVKRGFHKVYLTTIIVSDGRNKIANNIFFNHASPDTREEIYTSNYINKLDSKAGILFLEPAQLTSKGFNKQSGCRISEWRKPTPQEQPKELTKKIKDILDNSTSVIKPKQFW